MTKREGVPDGMPSLDTVIAYYLEMQDEGRAPEPDALFAAYPYLEDDLREYFADEERMRRVAATPDATKEEVLPIGSRLGAYRLDAVIGRGGMGTVYRATHTDLDRVVAIKVLPTELAEKPELVDRFKREARALARLEHPNIVTVHDMATEGDAIYFIMEHVEGANLRQLMATGELTSEKALGIVPEICQALEYAHDAGVVHRDIKPENILVDRAGNVKIADFGLAKLLREEPDRTNLTRTDMVLGTFNYMAPEQRKSSAIVDHRADIYALGVVLFEMLTGELPVGRFSPPSEQQALDNRIDDVVLKALEQEPDRRYQRASHMGNDVSQVIDTPVAARGEPANGPGAREIKVVKSESGEQIGGGEAQMIRIVARSEEECTIRGWSRPEVGLTVEDYDGGVYVTGMVVGLKPRLKFVGKEKLRRFLGSLMDDPDDETAPDEAEVTTGTVYDAHGQPTKLACIEVHLPEEEATVYVPPDLPVEIECPQGELRVVGIRGGLHLSPGTGDATLSDIGGSVHADRLEEGGLEVNGLSSTHFHLSTQEGELTVSGLRLTEGQGSIHTNEGKARLGILPDSSVRLEARSHSGSVVTGFGAVLESSNNHAIATIGGGHARLEVTTGAGTIDIQEQSELSRRRYVEKSLESLFGAAVIAGVFWWIGLDWMAVVILVGWALNYVWTAYEKAQAHA